MRSKKKHASLEKKPDSLVQQKTNSAAAAATTAAASAPKRKEPPSHAVKSYSLNRSACKILGNQSDKKRSKKTMDVLGMDVKKPATHQKKPHLDIFSDPFADSKKKPATHCADSQKKPHLDIFSDPFADSKKKEKKIMEKLGLTTTVELAFSQASLGESKATLTQTSASTTYSLLDAVATRAKVEIKDRDAIIMELENTILELQTSSDSEILTRYVSPPLDEERIYLGMESPPSEIKTKHHRLHYLNIIPQHLRSQTEEDEITELMNYFIDENKAGNVEGEVCGLGKMWIFPHEINKTIIHTIKGLNNDFVEFVDIKCKGECPSSEEGRTALRRGRQTVVKARENRTYFDDDEYLVNVSKDVCEHCFGVPLNSNAVMWITSRSGVCIYAFKNERDSLMLFTKGTVCKKKSYAECGIPKICVQTDVGEYKVNYIHRVMMMAISPIFDTKQWNLWEVDHIRREGKHNDVLNLRWVLQLTNKANYNGGKKQMIKKKKSKG